jgi:hypothetical protein
MKTIKIRDAKKFIKILKQIKRLNKRCSSINDMSFKIGINVNDKNEISLYYAGSSFLGYYNIEYPFIFKWGSNVKETYLVDFYALLSALENGDQKEYVLYILFQNEFDDFDKESNSILLNGEYYEIPENKNKLKEVCSFEWDKTIENFLDLHKLAKENLSKKFHGVHIYNQGGYRYYVMTDTKVLAEYKIPKENDNIIPCLVNLEFIKILLKIKQRIDKIIYYEQHHSEKLYAMEIFFENGTLLVKDIVNDFPQYDFAFPKIYTQIKVDTSSFKKSLNKIKKEKFNLYDNGEELIITFEFDRDKFILFNSGNNENKTVLKFDIPVLDGHISHFWSSKYNLKFFDSIFDFLKEDPLIINIPESHNRPITLAQNDFRAIIMPLNEK